MDQIGKLIAVNKQGMAAMFLNYHLFSFIIICFLSNYYESTQGCVQWRSWIIGQMKLDVTPIFKKKKHREREQWSKFCKQKEETIRILYMKHSCTKLRIKKKYLFANKFLKESIYHIDCPQHGTNTFQQTRKNARQTITHILNLSVIF